MSWGHAWDQAWPLTTGRQYLPCLSTNTSAPSAERTLSRCRGLVTLGPSCAPMGTCESAGAYHSRRSSSRAQASMPPIMDATGALARRASGGQSQSPGPPQTKPRSRAPRSSASASACPGSAPLPHHLPPWRAAAVSQKALPDRPRGGSGASWSGRAGCLGVPRVVQSRRQDGLRD